MYFDEKLFLNFIPVISAATITLVTCITIIVRLKNRWPIKVNCWFCNYISKVPRQSLDWWFCNNCEQYNGFSEDGDYNYEIPEQHKEINKKKIENSYCEKKPFHRNQNNLCKQCNKKEELKLLKLREIENSCDKFDTKQIEKFEKSFEKKYPLCLRCQNIVQKVLYKQMLWLTQYKMLLFKQKPIRRIVQNREWIEKILRVILSVLASVAIYYTEAWYLPLCGICFQLTACIASPANRRQSDVFPILGWICLIWVRAFSTTAILKMFKIHTSDEWTSDHDNTYQYFIIALGTAVCISNLKFKSHKTITEGSVSFKKLESSNLSQSFSRSPSPELIPQLQDEANSSNSCKEKNRNLHLPINITNTLMTSTNVETPIPLKSITNFAQWSREDSHISSPKRIPFKASNYSVEPEVTLLKPSTNLSYTLNDSLTSLNSLSLGNNAKISPFQSPKIFETKVYGTTNSEMFARRYNQRRSILAPPKLRSVNQASWVAGGYWQCEMPDIPSLSRSSSQSSGFGSTGSIYGASREPSIHDFDQCSVVSERCCFTRPESPLSMQNSTSTRRRSNHCSARCSQTDDVYCGKESLQYNAGNDSKCNGHTTVVTNPVWLSAFLCGSLVFNMVVLCTILLR